MVIAMAMRLPNISAIVLTIVLGFVFGFGLGVIPLLRAGFKFDQALKQVLVAESLSIAVMEGVEVLVAINIPGAMDAPVTAPLFWFSLLIGLTAGFIAAYPVNYFFVARGIRHQH